MWIKKLCERRDQYGVIQHDQTVQNIIRMSKQEYDNLCSFLSEKVKKCDTNYREAITVDERILLTLRFLATDETLIPVCKTDFEYRSRVSQ